MCMDPVSRFSRYLADAAPVIPEYRSTIEHPDGWVNSTAQYAVPLTLVTSAESRVQAGGES